MKFLKISIFCLVTFFTVPALAQEEILDLLRAAPEDAEKLTRLYTRPLFRGFGYGLNSGWYNTAATHKPLGVSFTINGSLAFVPSEDEFFTFRNSDYVSLRLTGGLEEDRSPTAFGPERDGPEVELFDPNTQQPLVQYNLPPGIGLEDKVNFNAVPVAVPQLSVGIVKNTDLIVRFMPEVGAGDDGSIKFWGLGIKHDIKQWIPGLKYAPFHLSVLAGYTNIDASFDFTDIVDPPDVEKLGVYDVTAFTFQVLASKRFSVITFYGGLGYNSVKSDFELQGSYGIDVDGNGSVDVTLEDPINFNVKDTGMGATLGFRLKLAVITIHADYTFLEYNVLNAGIGFSFRENKSMEKPGG